MNYIAYTIGPIYETILDTLQGDNKTKRLQSGSKYFSHFMKLLLKNIKNDFDILVPYVDGDILQNEYKMGLFHDRFIAQSEKSIQEIKDIFTIKLERTFKDIAREIEGEHIAKCLFKNMDNHLIVAQEEELKEVDTNIIFALNKILDTKELQKSFGFELEKNCIKKYQEQHINSSKVKTIEAISQKIGFNYYAVITADGDKMGAKIKNEATDNIINIKDISKKLFEFFTEKTDEDDIFTITNEKYGGELIYAGGDDILALVPVKKDATIFLDYVEKLNSRFKKIVGDDVSLSFGINIAYYKYPLRDAIQNAFELLHDAKAKSSNSIAIKITKHSGQFFETITQLDSTKYTNYKKLVDGILKEEITLPHSLHHSLKRYEEAILQTYRDNRTIDAMFDTVFNDAKSTKDEEGLQAIKEYLNSYKPTTNKEFDDIFSALSLIKFLREDRK
jgi:CRISPR-associated protein Cmr2